MVRSYIKLASFSVGPFVKGYEGNRTHERLPDQEQFFKVLAGKKVIVFEWTKLINEGQFKRGKVEIEFDSVRRINLIAFGDAKTLVLLELKRPSRVFHGDQFWDSQRKRRGGCTWFPGSPHEDLLKASENYRFVQAMVANTRQKIEKEMQSLFTEPNNLRISQHFMRENVPELENQTFESISQPLTFHGIKKRHLQPAESTSSATTPLTESSASQTVSSSSIMATGQASTTSLVKTQSAASEAKKRQRIGIASDETTKENTPLSIQNIRRDESNRGGILLAKRVPPSFSKASEGIFKKGTSQGTYTGLPRKMTSSSRASSTSSVASAKKSMTMPTLLDTHPSASSREIEREAIPIPGHARQAPKIPALSTTGSPSNSLTEDFGGSSPKPRNSVFESLVSPIRFDALSPGEQAKSPYFSRHPAVSFDPKSPSPLYSRMSEHDFHSQNQYQRSAAGRQVVQESELVPHHTASSQMRRESISVGGFQDLPPPPPRRQAPPSKKRQIEPSKRKFLRKGPMDTSIMSETDAKGYLGSLSVSFLKEQLDFRGLRKTGKKSDLISRIVLHDRINQTIPREEEYFSDGIHRESFSPRPVYKSSRRHAVHSEDYSPSFPRRVARASPPRKSRGAPQQQQGFGSSQGLEDLVSSSSDSRRINPENQYPGDYDTRAKSFYSQPSSTAPSSMPPGSSQQLQVQSAHHHQQQHQSFHSHQHFSASKLQTPLRSSIRNAKDDLNQDLDFEPFTATLFTPLCNLSSPIHALRPTPVKLDMLKDSPTRSLKDVDLDHPQGDVHQEKEVSFEDDMPDIIPTKTHSANEESTQQERKLNQPSAIL